MEVDGHDFARGFLCQSDCEPIGNRNSCFGFRSASAFPYERSQGELMDSETSTTTDSE